MQWFMKLTREYQSKLKGMNKYYDLKDCKLQID